MGRDEIGDAYSQVKSHAIFYLLSSPGSYFVSHKCVTMGGLQWFSWLMDDHSLDFLLVPRGSGLLFVYSVNENGWAMDLIGIQLSSLNKLFDFSHHTLCSHRHVDVKVLSSFVED